MAPEAAGAAQAAPVGAHFFAQQLEAVHGPGPWAEATAEALADDGGENYWRLAAAVGYANPQPPCAVFGELAVILLAVYAGYALALQAAPRCRFRTIVLIEYLTLTGLAVAFTYGVAAHIVLPLLAAAAAGGGGGRLRSGTGPSLDLRDQDQRERPAFVSLSRSLMAVSTLFAIFAVDFAAFPRRYAKSLEYGLSAMDIGTGMVIFGQGLVHKRNSPLRTRLTSLKVWASAAVGLLRAFGTRSLDYNVPVHEYGVHWNFFFTIAAVGALEDAPVAWLALPLEVLYRGMGLDEWVFRGARGNFVAANREGLIGIIGYAAIYKVGVLVGKRLRRLHKQRRPAQNIALECLAGFSVLGAVQQGAAAFGWLPSRRLVNLPYILAVMAFGFLLSSYALLVELLTTPDAYLIGYQRMPGVRGCAESKFISFIIANIVVGLVQVARVKTFLLSNFEQVLFIAAYTAIWQLSGMFSIGARAGYKNDDRRLV